MEKRIFVDWVRHSNRGICHVATWSVDWYAGACGWRVRAALALDLSWALAETKDTEIGHSHGCDA